MSSLTVRLLAATVALTSLANVSEVSAQTSRPASKSLPSIAQFMKIRSPGSPTLAPDGTLYVVDWPDGINQLYRRDAGAPIDAPMTKLTDFQDGINSYELSPDGSTIVISAAIGGSEQNDLFRLDSATGAINDIFRNPEVVYGFQRWLDDSSGFIYSANDESASDFHLYRYDLKTGSSSKLLSQPGYWEALDVTADGSRLLVANYQSASLANAYELVAETGELSSLNIADGVFNWPGAYLPDGEQVIVLSDMEEGIRRMFVTNPKTGRFFKPFPDLDPYPIESGAINRQRTLAAVTYNEGGYGSMRLYQLPDFTEVSLPAMDRGLVSSVDIRDRTVTWMLESARTPGLAYAYELDGSSAPRALTVVDDQGIDLASFTLPELITYASFDGLEIPAFLYTPPGYRPGTPIPFVIIFHGGPEGQSRPNFSRTVQYLLGRGFGVMQPNVRGSTGYGSDFQMLDNYKQRWDSVRDGVEAARWLVQRGYARPGEIAAYGGSYGGFMAVATVIEGADVFGASVDVVGVVNFKTFLEQTKDYRRKLREVEYGPLSDPEFLESISPINRIDEIKVPMLIAHGLNDPRVPIGEAMQLAVGLQKRGYDPELIFFPDEGHGFAKLENRLLFYERVAGFLEEQIGSRKTR